MCVCFSAALVKAKKENVNLGCAKMFCSRDNAYLWFRKDWKEDCRLPLYDKQKTPK